jgi:diguanylate cyclase (GGDEF)-like protein/PAS domain S-box-containing protein
MQESSRAAKSLAGQIRRENRRIHVEELLRSSVESHLEAQRIAGIGNFVIHVLSGECFGSTALHELMGVSLDIRCSFRNWITLVHPEDRMELEHAVSSFLNAQIPSFDYTFRVFRRDNHAMRWVHALAKMERNRRGRPVLIRGTMQDITRDKAREDELRQSKELLQLFIEHAPVALAMFDREMRYLAASRRWLENNLLETGESVLGRNHYELHPSLTEQIKEAHRRGLAGEAVSNDREKIILPDGSIRWSRWDVRPWRTGDGEIGGILIFTEDVTSKMQIDERVLLAAQVFSNIREGILIADADGLIVDVNESFTRITGYHREEVLGRDPRFLNAGQQTGAFYDQIQEEIKRDGQWSGNLWSRRKDGSVFAESLNITTLCDDQGNLRRFIGLFSDVTQQKENERRLQYVAHYDVLTGLPNRVLLADRLYQAMAHAQRSGHPLAVAYLDLDNFKAVNDTFGHAAGDQLLTDVAGRMKRVLREGDTLARLGGDEFVAVLIDLEDTEICTGILRRLLDAASEPFESASGLAPRVSASVGVAFYPQPEEINADQLLRQADQAMYHAKLSGRNCYHFYDHDLDRSLLNRRDDLQRIRQALAAGEFELFYQPWVNMRLGEVLGVEALIRWRHPTRGLLPPAMFLPQIEEHELAAEVGEWVFATALRQMEEWNAKGLRLHLGLNVSAMHLQCKDFSDRLKRLLASHPGVRPWQIEIDVLETNAFKDIVQVSKVIEACGELGVSFAIDDFGAGYSSLTYLKRLPSRIIKIDQSFVRGILNNAEDVTIIEGVLGLASAFHRQVVAEGVETAAHGRVLLNLGCDVAQGYGIAHPMPAANLSNWIAAWEPDPSWRNAPVFSEADRPLLYVTVDHRAWIHGLEALLRGESLTEPPVSPSRCRLRKWLSTLGPSCGRDLGLAQTLEALDCELHHMAKEILDLHKVGRVQDAQAKLQDLNQLGEEFFLALKRFSLKR